MFDFAVGATVLTPAQQRLATEMRGHRTRFAMTGDPNGDGTVTWPRFGADGGLRILSGAGSTTTTAAGFAAVHRCALWR